MSAMLSGEIHYWRVPRERWSAVLDAARSLGVRTIASYVPWEHHERAPGVHDFEELSAFLALVESKGFTFFARPGPFIYAEWKNLGVPDRVVGFAKHTPEFRAAAAEWIAAVMRELQPRLGRLVIAVQADNEIDPMPHFHGEDQGFAAWLARRFASVAELNAAWGTDYRGFDEALPTLYPFREDARYRDSQQYRFDLATDYARFVVGEYRKHCGATPIVLNTWPYVNAQNWRDLAELADVYGIDPYPDAECNGDASELLEQLRTLRMVAREPFVAEFGAGVWRGATCDYGPDHYRLLAHAALAAGVRGWNWYMLVERDNWQGSPINERGDVDPRLGPAFRDAVVAFERLEHAPAPETSFAVTWSWRWQQTAATRRERPRDPLFAALAACGCEWDFVDVERELGAPRVLFVAGEIDEPRPLFDYVERGGTLVCFQTLIAGVPRPDGTSHHAPDALESSLGFVTRRPVFAYRRVPGEPIVAVQRAWTEDPDQRLLQALAVGREYVTGFIEPRGAGRLVVVGCEPSREAVLAVLARLRAMPPAWSATPGVHVAKRGDELVLVNAGRACTARVRVGERELVVDLPRAGGAITKL
ncbi:MAG: beta-galactosidase [Planctomycetes bacterium]|nr:beta-galactosidase [Planctomycetota bacterium]